MENKIFGFLELNGDVIKISSVEDIKTLAARLGSAFTELSVNDFEKLCGKIHGEYNKDDCGVLYSKDGKQLLFAPITSDEYIIKTGTIAIASDAFNWHYYLSNKVLCANKCIHEKIIKKLLIPDSVIAIGREAFSDNVAITNIIVSQKLEYIGQKAFSGCWKVVDFILPSTIKYIETEAFDGCYNAFKELTIPASIKRIGSHAFRGCISLEKVVFLSTIDIIGSGIFESCDKLKEIIVPKGCAKQFCDQLPFYTGIITETTE
jgi:hypothetical protein